MKAVFLPLALTLVVSAQAEEWVSVGESQSVAPAVPVSGPAVSQPDSSIDLPLVHEERNAQSGDLVSELLLQVEQMQQEMGMLRSLVEQQQQQIQSMQQVQQERYLDLDRRVAALLQAPATSNAGTPATVVSSQSNDLPAADDAYKAAMTLVREKKFPQAITAFEDFSRHYSDSPLVANALYWAGEVQLVEGNTTAAKTNFQRVVTEYPDSNKAADATYKLGTTLHKEGDIEQAKVWLQKVIDQYSGRADATVQLAKSYLAKISS